MRSETNIFIMQKVILAVLLLVSFSLSAQTAVNHWETIVYASDPWKYFLGTSDPGTGWKSSSHDDSNWQSGSGGVGYGDSDDGTVVSPVMSVFLRKKFTITNLSQIEKLMLHVDHDDGF